MKIGLALGGGGVLGIAHLALLEELAEHNIAIDVLAGTSAGAIVAGLYASGGVVRVQDFFHTLEQQQFFSRKNLLLTRSPDNLFKKIESVLQSLIVEDNFSKLKTPLSVVATDIDHGRAVSINSGSVVKAIMASSAYPGVFPYQEIQGLRLCDGGVSNNLPADVAREMGSDFVIASSLNQISAIGPEHKLNRAAVAARALDIMQLELEKIQLSLADYCFLPPTEEYRWYNYEKIGEIYKKSRSAAVAAIAELRLAMAAKGSKHFFSNLLNEGE